MGAESTVRVTRDRLRGALSAYIIMASDSELEEMADAVLRDRLYNCRIVNTGEDNDDEILERGLKTC